MTWVEGSWQTWLIDQGLEEVDHGQFNDEERSLQCFYLARVAMLQSKGCWMKQTAAGLRDYCHNQLSNNPKYNFITKDAGVDKDAHHRYGHAAFLHIVADLWPKPIFSVNATIPEEKGVWAFWYQTTSSSVVKWAAQSRATGEVEALRGRSVRLWPKFKLETL